MKGTVRGTAADAAQARLEAALPHKPPRRLVIGVAIDAVRGEDNAGPCVADHLDHQRHRSARRSELTVWQAEGDPLA
jgi:hypothetical protein